MDIRELKEKFIEIYGKGEGIRAFFSPGRINLIGEHIDYNGGYVFPCAINYGTYAIARKRDDNLLKMSSTNFELKVESNVEDLKYLEEDDWTNYPKGVIKVMKDAGYKIGGFEVLFSGNIPNGAGLSSSASVEIAAGVIAEALFGLTVDRVELVKMCQTAENKFVGVNCGIMDQFAIGMGKKDHAILLDCNSLEYKYAPLVLKGYKLVITNSNKRRGLADSKYNERRSECDSALAKLQTKLQINALCEMTSEVFEANKDLIGKIVEIKRVKHAVYENERTKNAVEHLNKGDIEAFGKLLNMSHISLRDDYEVTGFELDSLVDEQWKVNGVAGSRMTGAGFGGCTISIVRDEAVETFKKQVAENYLKKTGLKAEFYVAEVGEGAGEIK